jgi:hypothetical protein
MEEFFASLYEWFGLNPLYSTDMGDQLRGWDITCTDYIGTPWYVIIGWIMITTTAVFYALQYHIIDSSRWKNKAHWWLFALIIVFVNFLIAFLIPYNSIQAGDYCNQLNISASDCIGFGLSNAVWSFILFTVITTIPVFRSFSNNCRHTTFWKP